MEISITAFVNGKPLNNSDWKPNGLRSTLRRYTGSVLPRHLWTALVFLLLPLQGCILIRTTEHRIQLRGDGSGEAVLRLIDLRSDETADSALVCDCAIMMSSFDKGGVEDFEKQGRKVFGKRFFVQGETLIAEITYTFPSLEAVEGLRLTNDEIFVVVKPEREIARTNGSIESWEEGYQRIVWPRDAKRIFFRISERSLPPSRSLARAYQEWMREH
jgi:hypothetical protein